MIASAPASATSTAIRLTRSSSTAPSIVQPKAVASPQAMRGRRSSGAVRHSATTRRKSSTDSAVLRRTFERLCPSLIDSTKFISYAEGQAAFSPLQVRDQRRDGEPRQRQRMTHDRLGIGELRQELRRDKRADLALPPPGA